MAGRLVAALVVADEAGALPARPAVVVPELVPAAVAGLKNELVALLLPPLVDIFGIGADRFLEGAPGRAALAAVTAGAGVADDERAAEVAGGGDRLADRSLVAIPASSDLRFFGAERSVWASTYDGGSEVDIPSVETALPNASRLVGIITLQR